MHCTASLLEASWKPAAQGAATSTDTQGAPAEKATFTSFTSSTPCLCVQAILEGRMEQKALVWL